MNEMVQFIKWLGRKTFGGMLNLLALIPAALKSFREELKDETGSSLFVWFLFTIAICIFVAIVEGIVGASKDQMIHGLLFTFGFAAGILVIVGTQALYDAFKRDQQKIIDALKYNEN